MISDSSSPSERQSFSGCRFSLSVMSDDFVPVILGAIETLGKPGDLRIETDDLSTLLIGPPRRVFQAVQGVYAEACRRGGHVTLSALFSRGCPGEPGDPLCTPPDRAPSLAGEVQAPPPEEGIPVSAHFSLYPLGDPGYMATIARAITSVQDDGVFGGASHFCTRLEGDISRVFASILKTFESVTADTPHVVLHLTASKGSPSKKPVQKQPVQKENPHPDNQNQESSRENS
ncbi:YkoF family thiamine/hydroxymethylpyrimidine-binding protein [Alkalispirochaeta alkalica]|uniref:YkoF family thiamine/hydroxymethylpyrimidine-binding protein n=1 Tax=Alkalispirochaeta alkalica TaxID=46356 RepID=UPI000379FCFC|nr:YkoF family thiamine/hydroxymethylpyrimidine-binding protein [Alkalispirochaeta alkalica]